MVLNAFVFGKRSHGASCLTTGLLQTSVMFVFSWSFPDLSVHCVCSTRVLVFCC